MLADYLIAPSLNALFVTGLILLTIIILLFKNYSSVMRLNYYAVMRVSFFNYWSSALVRV